MALTSEFGTIMISPVLVNKPGFPSQDSNPLTRRRGRGLSFSGYDTGPYVMVHIVIWVLL